MLIRLTEAQRDALIAGVEPAQEQAPDDLKMAIATLKSQKPDLHGITTYFLHHLRQRNGEWMINQEALQAQLFVDGFTRIEYEALRQSGVLHVYYAGSPHNPLLQIYEADN